MRERRLLFLRGCCGVGPDCRSARIRDASIYGERVEEHRDYFHLDSEDRGVCASS